MKHETEVKFNRMHALVESQVRQAHDFVLSHAKEDKEQDDSKVTTML